MVITWKRQTEQYSNGDNGFIGKYVFFKIVWDGISGTKDSPYLLKSRLPGFKDRLGHFESRELAIEKAETTLDFWLTNTNLQIKKDE